jgi:hypothetical protein
MGKNLIWDNCRPMTMAFKMFGCGINTRILSIIFVGLIFLYIGIYEVNFFGKNGYSFAVGKKLGVLPQFSCTFISLNYHLRYIGCILWPDSISRPICSEWFHLSSWHIYTTNANNGSFVFL